MTRQKIISIISLFILLASPFLVQADLISDLQKQIQNKQAQIQDLENKTAQLKASLKNNKTEQTTLNKQISSFEAQINRLETEIELTQAKISSTNLQIEVLDNDIQQKDGELSTQKEYLVKTIRTINEYDQESPLEIILKNDNFSDFLNQVQYVEDLQTGVQDKVEQIKQLKQELNDQKQSQEELRNSLTSLNTELKGKNLVLNFQKDGKEDLLSQTKNKEKQYQAMLSDLQKKRDQIEKEIYAAEEKLRQAINPSSLPGAHKGLFAWPITSAITQSYGCLVNAFAVKSYPACNEGRGNGGFHNGIDIDADLGDPIKAPLDGIVSGTGNLGKYAYGKWITINHNNGLTTLYGHLSVQSVTVGQKVKTGQIIGYAGSTGYSTGAHLHFTVYATNTFSIKQQWYGPLPLGGPVNPLNYLP